MNNQTQAFIILYNLSLKVFSILLMNSYLLFFLIVELQNLRGSQDEVLQKVQQQNGNDHVEPCRA